MPDWLWQKVEPLLPPVPSHPLGCHRPRIPDRQVVDAILLVLRTGMQWNALATDGAMSKAPLGGQETGPNPTDSQAPTATTISC